MSFKIGFKAAARETQNKRYVRMTSNRDGFCAECEQEIKEGEVIFWDTVEFKVFCKTCGEDLE